MGDLDLPPAPVIVDDGFDLGDRVERLGRIQQPVDGLLTIRWVLLEDVEHVDVDRRRHVRTDDVRTTELGGGRRETEPCAPTLPRWMRAPSRGRGGAEATRQRHLSLEGHRGALDEGADRDPGVGLESVAIVAGPKNESLALLKAGRHERVGVTLAVCDVNDGRACPDESGLGEVDAPLPAQELPVGVFARRVAGRPTLRAASRCLAPRQDLGMGEPQRAAPFARVDQQRHVQRKPRLAGVEVADLLGVGVWKRAMRRVVDRKDQPRTAGTLRRPQRVCIEEVLE